MKTEWDKRDKIHYKTKSYLKYIVPDNNLH